MPDQHTDEATGFPIAHRHPRYRPGSANNSESGGNGIGMFNTRDRLQHLFGDDFVLTCGNRADGGFAVHVRLPWHLTELKKLELNGDPE